MGVPVCATQMGEPQSKVLMGITSLGTHKIRGQFTTGTYLQQRTVERYFVYLLQSGAESHGNRQRSFVQPGMKFKAENFQ